MGRFFSWLRSCWEESWGTSLPETWTRDQVPAERCPNGGGLTHALNGDMETGMWCRKCLKVVVAGKGTFSGPVFSESSALPRIAHARGVVGDGLPYPQDNDAFLMALRSLRGDAIALSESLQEIRTSYRSGPDSWWLELDRHASAMSAELSRVVASISSSQLTRKPSSGE